MITGPVAVTRAVLVTTTVWGLGAAVTAALFSSLGASSTIELGNDESRVQLVWLGAHAFVGCLAALVGVILGASALISAGTAAPRPAVLLVGSLTFAWAIGGSLVLSSLVGPATAVAMAAGLGVGTAGAMIFVAQSGDPRGDLPYQHGTVRSGRGWSTR